MEDDKDMLADHPLLHLVWAGAGACLDVHDIAETGLIKAALEGGQGGTSGKVGIPDVIPQQIPKGII